MGGDKSDCMCGCSGWEGGGGEAGLDRTAARMVGRVEWSWSHFWSLSLPDWRLASPCMSPVNEDAAVFGMQLKC